MGNTSLLNLISAILGFIVSGMLIFSNNHNRKVNFLLGIAFTVSAYRSISLFLLDLNLVRNTIVMGTMSFLYYLIAPAFYLYFRQNINQGKNFTKSDLKHLAVPVLMALLPLLYLFITLINTGSAYLPKQSLDILAVKPFKLYISVKEHAYIITFMCTIYAFASWKLYIKGFKKRELHPQEVIMKNWILSILTIASFMTLLLLVSAVITWATGIQSTVSVSDFAVIRNFILLVLFSRVLFKRDLLFGIPELPTALPTVLDKLDSVQPFVPIEISEPSINKNEEIETKIEYPDDFDEYGWVIDNIGDSELNIETEKIALYIRQVSDYLKTKPFLDPEFNMKYISKELNVPHYHIEYLFRYYNRYAFTEFRNMLRVKYVINRFNEGAMDSLSLEGIGKDAGFNSRSSFFRVFKQVTGQSPKQFAEGTEDDDDETF